MSRLMLLGLLPLLAVFACASARQIADHAFVVRDWDRAVEYYDRAIDQSLDRAETEYLKRRRIASAQRAASAHLAQARRLFAEGRPEAALAETQAARRFNPSEVVRGIEVDLSKRHAEALRQEAVASWAAEDWAMALRRLTRAQELSPTPEGAEMFARAERRIGEWHGEQLAPSLEEARAAMEAREWARAVTLFAESREHGVGARLENEAAFCRRMRDAEAAAANAEYRKAKGLFEAALAHGVMSNHVLERMLAKVPHRYAVTLHGVIVLPFKPGGHIHWDRAPGIPDKMPGAELLLANLSYYLTGEPDLRAAELARDMAEYELEEAAPDCFPIVTGPGLQAGDRTLALPDRLAPVWNLRFEITGRTEDAGMVSVLVRDRDDRTEEDVGVWQITAGELVSIRGTRTLFLFDGEGNLHNRGLLALRVTVEPVR